MKTLLTVATLLLASCTNDGKYSSSIARLGLNYTAKSMCSCLWVSENTEEFCREYTKLDRVTPKITVDQAAKTVTTSLFWVLTAEAHFIDERNGCQIGGL